MPWNSVLCLWLIGGITFSPAKEGGVSRLKLVRASSTNGSSRFCSSLRTWRRTVEGAQPSLRARARIVTPHSVCAKYLCASCGTHAGKPSPGATDDIHVSCIYSQLRFEEFPAFCQFDPKGYSQGVHRTSPALYRIQNSTMGCIAYLKVNHFLFHGYCYR